MEGCRYSVLLLLTRSICAGLSPFTFSFYKIYLCWAVSFHGLFGRETSPCETHLERPFSIVRVNFKDMYIQKLHSATYLHTYLG
jgi:hypothetical protein